MGMRHRLDWLLPVAVLLFLCVAGCSDRRTNVVVRPISGTEQVSIDLFSISVSPDERWLALTEWVLPKSRVYEALSAYEYEVRIATMDLQTGEVVPARD